MNGTPYRMDAIPTRFPRLIRLMRWTCALSQTEATNAIYMHSMGDNFAGEAVNVMGGVRKVLLNTIRTRHIARRYA